MAKTINIAAHVKRYENTDPVQLLAFVEELKTLAEKKKQETIEQMEVTLQRLKNGEPIEQPVKPKRGNKKEKQTTEE